MYPKSIFRALLFFVVFQFALVSFISMRVQAEEAASDYLEDALLLEEKSDVATEEEAFVLPGVGEVIFRMVFFLGVVLLLMAGFFIAAKKWLLPKGMEANSRQEAIKVLAHRRMDAKNGIYLVEVLGKILVIGSDIEGLNLITEITAPEKIAEAQQMRSMNLTPEVYKLNPFQGILERFSGDYQAVHTAKGANQKPSRQLLKKMDELKSRLSK